MRYGRYVWPAICALLVACTSQDNAPDRPGASEPVSAADSFVGSWALVSWTRTSEERETIYPYGEDAFGRILYQPNGRMTALLMRRDRPKVSSDRPPDPTPEEMRAMLNGFFAYSGGYTVDPEQGTVTHHVEACLNPNWVGTDRVRKFERIGEDRIVLRPVETTLPTELIWQREK